MKITSGFYILIGKQGSGKTLMATKLAIDDTKRRIFSNFTLYERDFQAITFNSDIDENKDKIDILKMLDKNPNFFDNSIMLLDEMHVYFDSLDFYRANSRRMQTFFSQLRKRKILLIGTTQYLLNLDVRLRRQAFAVMEMNHVKKSFFRVTTSELDGMYSRYISTYIVDLKNYYKHYNTYELVL